MSLFRKQAIENRKQRLHGDVLLLPKVSHSVLLIFLLIWVGFVLTWLFTSHYARKETVLGWLEPPSGVVRLYPENAGTIQQIFVLEGSVVEKDQPLMTIKVEAFLSSGEQLASHLIDEYQAQSKLIEEQLSRTHSIYSMRALDIEKKILAAEQESIMLNEQLKTIDQQYHLISIQAERFRKLKRDGYVSNLDFENSIMQELALKNEKQSIMRNKIIQDNLIEQLKTAQKILPDELANAVAQLREKLSDIAQQVAQVSGQNTRIIKASRAGIVNNLQASEGQQVSVGTNIPMLTLIPHDVQLTAHLLVPVRSAGFLDVGQSLNIRFDAFPYQKFGIYEGTITQVSKTVLLPSELLNAPISMQEPTYRITARLKQLNVHAYGKDFPLKPGMTLSADIRLSDRTLFQWLLEPIYSLKGRL